jgi:sulfoxide reductase catalytic subunit YedY
MQHLDNQVTREALYFNRRHFLRLSANRALQLASVGSAFSASPAVWASQAVKCNNSLSFEHDELTPFISATHYNNFFEFSPDKKAVAILAQELTTEPWDIEVGGLVENPISLSIYELKKLGTVDRTYHLRCVEGWSMVIPWTGVQLCKLIEKVKPKKNAQYVKFTSIYRPKEMISQRRPTMDWPYVEALRLDEAQNPLTLLATGMYGKSLPKQNGAPLRLVVPWKYGFKSIKTIKKIEFVSERPQTSWMSIAPSEYGFFANVNPDVAHPRWSQRKEVRIGEIKKRSTKPFNGYEEHVAHLYQDMDLKENF